MANDKNPASGSRRLPIVFCLDVSPSMNGKAKDAKYSRIQLLNKAIQNFLEDLNSDAKVRASAEVAFVTFSTKIEMDTDFEQINTDISSFATVKEGGTNTATAIIKSFEKIKKEKQELDNLEISSYSPFFVLVTDGNPDKNDNSALMERAISIVQQHCDSQVGGNEIIVPFIIGVGSDVEVSTLNRLSERFTGNAFVIDDAVAEQTELFNDFFAFIKKSVTGSVHLNANTPQEQIAPIITDGKKLLEKVEAARRKANQQAIM